MEFEGRISRVLPARSGISQRGEWKALPFVFEYFESGDQRWPDRVLLETFDTNIMAQIGAYLKKGTDGKAVVENDECVLLYELKCRIGFSHSVRSFDRQDGTKATVNDIRCYKFEIAGQQAKQPAAHQAPPQAQLAAAPVMPPPAPFPPQVDANGNPTYDDLPF
jgi:hypothetical protein